MQKSLFRKYLWITSLIILISFICLGTVMTVFAGRYWNGQRVQLLEKNAHSVANVAETSLTHQQQGTYVIDGKRMEEFVSAFSENINAFILVTDVRGDVVMEHNSVADTGVKQSVDVNHVPEDVIERVVQGGGYQGINNLGGYFQQDCVVVGVPIVVETSAGMQTVIGTVFAATENSFFGGYLEELIKMFFLAALAAFLVAFAIAWLFSYRITHPLREMSDATKSFALGDFSVRVPVYGSDEISELATAFNTMAETLSASETMNRNFIANVSHELKTPMTTISGFVDGILDGTIPPEKQNHYLKIVSEEVRRLSRLVKTMLDLSRIDSGKMQLHPSRFDLKNTIFVALLTFEQQIDEKHLEILGLDTMDSLYLNGDPDMLHQVLYNLLENAVKFTNEGGYIKLLAKAEQNRVVVAIENSGPGIPPEDVKLIFDRFYKTDKSRSKDKMGMGLGLFLVRTMISLHGGEIAVESVENQYTRFTFWLPTGEEKREKKSVKSPLRGKGKSDAVEVMPVEQAAPSGVMENIVGEAVEVVDVTDSAVESQDKQEGR